MRTESENTQRNAAVPTIDLAKLREVKLKDYLLRFILGAIISVGAVLIVQTAGPRLGGMFLAFPSILPASLTLVEKKQGTRHADRSAIGAILGALGLSIFALVVEKTILNLEPFLALAIALLSWFISSLVFYMVLAFIRPDLCDKDKD